MKKDFSFYSKRNREYPIWTSLQYFWKVISPNKRKRWSALECGTMGGERLHSVCTSLECINFLSFRKKESKDSLYTDGERNIYKTHFHSSKNNE